MLSSPVSADSRVFRVLSCIAAMVLGALLMMLVPVERALVTAPKPAVVRPHLCITKHVTRKALGLGFATPPERAALANNKRWTPGTTLTYTFAGGTLADRQELIDAADEWMKYANIKLVHVETDPADVRILIDNSGSSYAYVGTDIRTIPANEPNMVIGWPDDPGRSLHEWGHVLSLIHELQIPGNGIKWNLAALKAAYNGPPNDWSDADIYEQIIEPSSEPLANGSAFDKFSIMAYATDGSLLQDSSQAIPWNQVLSTNDKKLIAGWLPK